MRLCSLNDDLLTVLIMCRLAVRHMSHLFGAVQTKEAMNKCVSLRLEGVGWCLLVVGCTCWHCSPLKSKLWPAKLNVRS